MGTKLQPRKWPSTSVTFSLELSLPGTESGMEKIAKTPTPRLIKTHLPYGMLESQVNVDKAKFIVVTRNPKDTLVSLYHFYSFLKAFGPYSGTWDQFFDEMVKTGELVHGDLLVHNLHWWQNRHKENVLVVRYEDMKTDLNKSVERVATFLGKEMEASVIKKISEASSFSSMKSNPATNFKNHPGFDQTRGQFMRKGVIGDWRNYFSLEQSRYIDELCDAIKESEVSDPLFLNEHVDQDD